VRKEEQGCPVRRKLSATAVLCSDDDPASAHLLHRCSRARKNKMGKEVGENNSKRLTILA
jgi:hypothetical protein